MKKLFLLALSAFLLLPGCDKETVGPVTDIGVYFNEIQSTGGDWLEIYNSTSATINLSGFKVYDDPANKFPIASGSISANGFFVVTCDGTGVGGNASFKLSSSGETIYLEDNKGNLIDEVTFPALTNRSSYARFPDGEDWAITGDITKGVSNGTAHAPTISSVSRNPTVPGLADAVTISVKATDVDGITSVKLYSRKDANPFTSQSMVLSSGTYSATIAAANATGTVEYYIEATNGLGVTSYYPSTAPVKTFSYLLNTDMLPQLYINEFMAFNSTCCPDVDAGFAEYNDWIEIYNATANAIDLSGYYLSDSLANPFKFKIEGSAVIQPNGFLVIWADEQGSQGVLHTSFQLSATGEEIGLYYIDGRKIDDYQFGSQTEDKSWGRTTNGGTWGTGPRTPTKGASNN
jgi:hypothetical protein